MPTHDIPLICIKCDTTLETGTDHLSCPGCQACYPVRDGIPIFAEDQPYWGDIPEKKMVEVVDKTLELGWQRALVAGLEGRSPEQFDYLTNPAQARWKHYFPLPENSRILDLGSDLGAIAFGLAQSGHTVVAAEPVWARIKFLQLRAKQEGISNIVPVCAGTFEIPFPDGFFDGIVLNNVLEWVALSRPDQPPEVVQQDVLKNLACKLKPGGYLHLVIGNRWAPLLLGGLRDPHSGLRYTSFLPRRLANAYSRYKRGQDYRTYLYSRKGYGRLLRRAGFDLLHFFGLLPNARTYFYYLPLDRPGILKSFLNTAFDPKHPGASWLARWVYRMLPVHWFLAGLVAHFSIFARRADDH